MQQDYPWRAGDAADGVGKGSALAPTSDFEEHLSWRRVLLRQCVCTHGLKAIGLHYLLEGACAQLECTEEQLRVRRASMLVLLVAVARVARPALCIPMHRCPDEALNAWRTRIPPLRPDTG